MLRTLCRRHCPPPWADLTAVRRFARVTHPADAEAEPIIRVSNNIARLGPPKDGPKPRQLLSLPPFPPLSSPNLLPGRKLRPTAAEPDRPVRVTAITWVKHYFDEVPSAVIQSHFNKGLVHVETPNHSGPSCLKKIKHNHAMETGMKIHLPVSVAESKIKKRYETIPTATLNPNADEIEYIQRLVVYKDSAIIVLNKPPKVPVEGNLPVHNSMDALAAAALSYGNKEGPRLVFLNDGKMERVILAHPSGMDGSQEAVTEYRVMGPTINGCSWIELRPLTGRKHQLRVHCAEALGTPIVGDYKYGWFVHKRWKQMPRVDYEPSSGEPYKLRRPEGLEVQKGSVLSKVPSLHLHCRETVIPNISKFLGNSGEWYTEGNPWSSEKPSVLRFVAPMPSHMKISWNLMSSYLV